MEWNLVEDFLIKEEISFKKNACLKTHSYFKTGGTAKYIIFPSSKNKLIEVIRELRINKLPFKIIGNTTNLLFLDDVIYSCLIDIKALNNWEFLGNGIFSLDLGCTMPDISRLFLNKGLSGAEGLEGIPGTVGAGILMNAGAYGSKISDILLTVDVLLPNGEIHSYDKSDIYFGHRESTFKSPDNNDIILSCQVRGTKGDMRTIYNSMSLYHNKRHKYQEWMYPNLGSLFTQSIYRYLAKKSLSFKIVSGLYIFFNYKFRIFRRESPDNRIWLNQLVSTQFGLSMDKNMSSPKDLNTLINSGQHTDEVLAYIHELQELTDNKIELENEIVNKF